MLFCKKCGAVIGPGQTHCSVCHTPATTYTPPNSPTSPGRNPYVPPRSPNPYAPSYPTSTYTPPQPPKKKKSKLPLIISLVVLLVAALGAGGYFLYPVLFGGGSDSSAGSDQSVAVPGQTGPGSSTESSGLYAGGYIYFSSDRVFCSAQDMEPDTAAAPLLNGSNSTDASAVCFSPDGHYACIRLSPSYSDLYRVDLSQLEDDLSSNLENATLIASTVAEAPIVQDDGTVLYVTEDQDLFCFNGQQSQFVADHVSELVKTASNQVIVRFSDGNIDNIDLSNPTVLRSATSGCQQVFNLSDPGNILYTSLSPQHTLDLYRYNPSGEDQLLCKDVTIQAERKEPFCLIYSCCTDRIVKPEDCVSGNIVDSPLRTPRPEDFTVPIYEYHKIDNLDTPASGYDELFTACDKPLFWFGENSKTNCSMREAITRNWNQDTATIQARAAEFVRLHEAEVNEDGFIPVDSRLQQELIAFNRLDTNTNNADSHWIYLCYYREQVGQTTDYASYEQAVANANMALQNAQERYAQNLYIFKDGKNTLLTDEALNIEPCNQAVLYDTVSMLRQRYQASASLNTNELFSNMASLSDSYANGILPLGRTKPLTYGSALSPNQWVFRQNGCEIYAAGDHLYSLCDGTLYGAELSGDTITGVTAISNNHPLVMVGADQRLYFVVGDSSGTIFDLYVCEGKNPGLIVSGIALQHILTYEDGAMIYTTADGQVSMCLPNKTQFSSPANAELLCRLDGNSMLYRVNGTLVLNRNGEETELRNNALFFWPAVPLSCGRCVSFDYPFRSSWN